MREWVINARSLAKDLEELAGMSLEEIRHYCGGSEQGQHRSRAGGRA